MPYLTQFRPVSFAVGLALLCTGVVLVSLSVPALLANPAFTSYAYGGENPEVNLLLDMMTIGALLFPFGVIFISKGRKKKEASQK